MDKKVVLFTANVQGGILQLTLQLYKTLKEEKFNVCVVMPYITLIFANLISLFLY